MEYLAKCAIFDALVINLEGSDEHLESVRHMLDREQIAWRRMPAVVGRHGMQEGDYDYDESAAIIRHDRPLNTGKTDVVYRISRRLACSLQERRHVLLS